MTDPLYCKYGTFSFFTSTIAFNLKPSSHHLPRLALLFAGGVILVYLMNEIKMLLLLLYKEKNQTQQAENDKILLCLNRLSVDLCEVCLV